MFGMHPDINGTSPNHLEWDVTVHCTFEKSPEKCPMVGNITLESFPVGIRVQTVSSRMSDFMQKEPK